MAGVTAFLCIMNHEGLEKITDTVGHKAYIHIHIPP